MEKIAIYPGTFDPFTNGHLDIVVRSLRIFDRVIVAVTNNPQKKPLFSIEERVNLINESIQEFGIHNVSVERFDGLLVNYVERKKGIAVIRGLRAVSDFEYELQMALINRRLNPNIDTIFKMPSEEYSFVTSTAVKEIASFGGAVRGVVPKVVEKALKDKYRTMNEDIS